MAHRFLFSNECAKRLTNTYYDMIVKDNEQIQQNEQILYKPLYKNLLSQTSKYITDIEILLSKIKILLNEQIKEDNIINQT